MTSLLPYALGLLRRGDIYPPLDREGQVSSRTWEMGVSPSLKATVCDDSYSCDISALCAPSPKIISGRPQCISQVCLKIHFVFSS